jgi:hypothetical protein
MAFIRTLRHPYKTLHAFMMIDFMGEISPMRLEYASCAGKGCSCTKPWAPTRWWMLKRLPLLNRSFCSYHPPWRREDNFGTVNRRFTRGKPRRMSAQRCDHRRWRSYLYYIKRLEVIAACLVHLTSATSTLHGKNARLDSARKLWKRITPHVPRPL